MPSETPSAAPGDDCRPSFPVSRHVWINRRDPRLSQCPGVTPEKGGGDVRSPPPSEVLELSEDLVEQRGELLQQSA